MSKYNATFLSFDQCFWRNVRGIVNKFPNCAYWTKTNERMSVRLIFSEIVNQGLQTAKEFWNCFYSLWMWSYIMAYGAVWRDITSGTVISSIFSVMVHEYIYSQPSESLVCHCILYTLFSTYKFHLFSQCFNTKQLRGNIGLPFFVYTLCLKIRCNWRYAEP